MSEILFYGLMARHAASLFEHANLTPVWAENVALHEDRFGMPICEANASGRAELLRVSRLNDADVERIARWQSAYALAQYDLEVQWGDERRVLPLFVSQNEVASPEDEAFDVLLAAQNAASDGLARAAVIGAGYRFAAYDLASLDQTPATIRYKPKAGDVKILKRDVLNMGFYSADRLFYQHQRYDGTWSDTIAREMLVTGDAAIILPYDPKRDEVVLIEQLRPSALTRKSDDAWELEAVAGLVGIGETAEETARRELEEEAGLVAKELYSVAPCYQSPGCLSQFMYMFIAHVDLSGYQAGQFGLDEEQEDIRSHILSRDEAIGLLKSGEANNAPLQILLYALALDHAEIVQSWLANINKP